MRLEGFKNNDVHEVEQNHSPEKTVPDATDHQDHKKRLEDYSHKELFDMARYDPKKVTELNNDFRERYEAEIRDMSVEEYREYKNKLGLGSEVEEKSEHQVHKERLDSNTYAEDLRTSVVLDNSEKDTLKSSLKSFEQTTWDKLDINEKKEQISNLCNAVADELGIQDKPSVCYFKGNESDYGGYSRSENAVYINENTLHNGPETADTVAHETRHCWQYERAENPVTEQDCQFKENIENYIKPEDDYRGYKRQAVEIDASEFASKITEKIPVENSSEKTFKIIDFEDKKTSFSELNPEKGAVFDKIELPDDLKLKSVDSNKLKEAPHWERTAKLVNAALEVSDGPILKTADGKEYKALSQEEKIQLSNALKEYMNSIPDGQRGDFRVPEPEKISGIRVDDGRILEAWRPNCDGAKDGTRKMEIVKAGTLIDRIGAENGAYFSPMDANGKPYDLQSRAIGDHLPKENIEENESYHKYIVLIDFTKENFEKQIDKYILDSKEHEKYIEKLNAYYKNAANFAEGHPTDTYAPNSNGEYNGVKSGTIDNMFTENDGGAKQFLTPFDAGILIYDLKMIDEVNAKNELDRT